MLLTCESGHCGHCRECRHGVLPSEQAAQEEDEQKKLAHAVSRTAQERACKEEALARVAALKAEIESLKANVPQIKGERAPKAMVEQLVAHLDADDSGSLDRDEIKELFSKMSGVPVTDIPSDHPEVVAFSDITTTQLVEKLWAEASREKIETFHAALGLAPPC